MLAHKYVQVSTCELVLRAGGVERFNVGVGLRHKMGSQRRCSRLAQPETTARDKRDMRGPAERVDALLPNGLTTCPNTMVGAVGFLDK